MIRTAALAFAIAAASFPAAAAPVTTRNFSVTGFDRIRLDGPYRVQMKTGVAPFARATGSAAALDGVDVEVEGRTLVVRPAKGSWGGYPGQPRGPVEIAVGTHELGTAWINGPGMLEIDRIEGLSFDLAMQGAGSARIGEAEVDQLKIGMSGAGTLTIAGKAPKLTAIVRGSSVLDASGLKVKDATIGAEGSPTVRADVSGSAGVDAHGVAVVELSGHPACDVKARGSATVAGCR